MTRVTSLVLSKHGFEVQTTNRSFGVLNLVAMCRPDAVVLDINMPGLMGDELIGLIRGDAELRSTRVVLFSGVPERELRDRARRAGAHGFVHKSQDLARLMQVLRAVLRGGVVSEPAWS